jgi:colanic acid biosynthesis glycosyl transferase WcaI
LRILLYGINYAPELTGIGKYTGEMAAFLAASGDEVEVITAPPYYPHWSVQGGYANAYREEYIDGVRVYRCPLYVPGEVTGPKRILHEFSFVLSSLRYWIPRYFRRYDAIVCISPPFHLGFPGLVHKWLHGTRVINHIQDLQVDAARDLGIIKNRSLLRFLEQAERWLLRRMSLVTTISTGMRSKLLAKGLPEEQLALFPNWVDNELVYPVARADSLRADWGFAENDRVVLYAGNLGEKQGLEQILLLAERLRNVARLTFVIVGEGGAKDRLIAERDRLGLGNVQFKPLQPLELLAPMLAAADVHLVLQKKAAADLVLPSKLTNILAVGGHALITAEPGTTLYDTAQEHRLGTIVAPEDIDALEVGLTEILTGHRHDDAAGAADYAHDYLAKETILSHFRRLLGFDFKTLNTQQHNHGTDYY